jgi:hypothetical protein
MNDDLPVTLVVPRVRPQLAPQPAYRKIMQRLFSDIAPAQMSSGVSARRLALYGAVVWLVTRLGLLVFTFMTSLFEAAHAAPPSVYFPAVTLSPMQMLHEWNQWDATFYQAIALHGYTPISTPYFPLYPLLIRIGLVFTTPDNAWLVGMIISNAMTLVGCIGVVFFAYQETSDLDDSRRTLILLLAYPLAFFLSAPYTEGLLLAFAAWSLWAARRGNWWLAALCVFLGVLSRPTGLILYLPLIVEYLRQHNWGRWRPLSDAPTALVALASGPTAFGLFSVVCWRYTGNPLIWAQADRIYDGRITIPVWKALYDGVSYYLARPAWSFDQFHHLTDFVPFVVMTALTIALSLRQPVSFTVYMVALIYLAIAGPVPVGWPEHHWVVFTSVGRYLLPSLPVWLALSRWSRRAPGLETLLVYGGILIQAVCATQFLLGRWMV